MRIIVRVKDKGILCGYVVDCDGYKYVTKSDIVNYNIENAYITIDGKCKAKDGVQIKNIDYEELMIKMQSRNTSVIGKPSLIYNTEFGKLSNTQLKVLKLLEKDNIVEINKSLNNVKITMKDLSCMTAHTGLEYGLFERNDKYIVVKGTERGINIDKKASTTIINGKYKWVGHTHPGNTLNCLMPSDADYKVLKLLNQKSSIIYNSIGRYYIFEKED